MAAGGGEAARQLADTDHPGQDDASRGNLPVNFSPEDFSDGLLRGVPFHEVVAGFGKHWEANSLGTEVGRSWAYSVKVGRNKYFVSHSWRSSGLLKWLSLLALSNSLLAAVGGTIATVLARMYYHYHTTTNVTLLPIQVRNTVWEVPATQMPCIAGYTVGLALFFGGHILRQFVETIGLSTPQTVFLDKLVIHQDDPERMKRGIALLGAFVQSSDVFLVLWSEHYLSRLWCSYELAVFLHLALLGHPGDFVVWPQPFTVAMAANFVGCGLTAFVMAAQVWIQSGSATGADNFGGFGWVVVAGVAVFPFSVISAAAIGHMHRNVATLEQQVAGYSLSNCDCFNEDDRAVVEASVAAWFNLGGADTHDKGNAIARFDGFVRRRLSESMAGVFAESGRPPFRAALCVAILMFWADTLSLVRPQSMPWTTHASLLSNSVIQDFSGSLLGFAYQYRVIGCIERCFRHKPYIEVPQDERTETTRDTVRGCAKLAVEVVAYHSTSMMFCALAFAPAMLPLPANICVSLGIVAWTVNEYW